MTILHGLMLATIHHTNQRRMVGTNYYTTRVLNQLDASPFPGTCLDGRWYTPTAGTNLFYYWLRELPYLGAAHGLQLSTKVVIPEEMGRRH